MLAITKPIPRIARGEGHVAAIGREHHTPDGELKLLQARMTAPVLVSQTPQYPCPYSHGLQSTWPWTAKADPSELKTTRAFARTVRVSGGTDSWKMLLSAR
jgi:hypothetical protein